MISSRSVLMLGTALTLVVSTGCKPSLPRGGSGAPAGGGGGAVPAHVTVLAPTKPNGIADLVDQVKSAVVNIDTVEHRMVQPDPFDMFFGNGNAEPQQEVVQGIGSGFFVRGDGLIVTNVHVVRGAEQLTVTLANGKRLPGRVVGADPATDLALVRINVSNAAYLQLADPRSLRVGQYVVAMGSPLGLQQTVTMGILSAIHRNIGLSSHVSYLQTDAAINPGNSGGPLMDLTGKVIGVNTAIARQAQGIGFAIPVDTLRTVIPQLERTGRVARPWLGVGISDLPPGVSGLGWNHGALINRVEGNSPAAQAGLRPGDLIVAVNGQSVPDAASLIRLISGLPIGARVRLNVVRNGQEKTLTLTLSGMPGA